MAKSIMIGNFKGGVAKTQTALEVAWYLAERGKKVLVIDTDHQAHLTTMLSAGVEITGRTIAEILINGQVIMPGDIHHRNIDKSGHRIDFIPASLALGRLEKKLSDDTPKEYILKDALETVQDQYDFVIIDAPPSAELISTAALVATDYLLIPTSPTTLGITGVDELMPMIKAIQSRPRMNPNLVVLGILVTMYDSTRDSHIAWDELKSKYEDLVINQVIRRCVKVRESNRMNMAVQEYEPNSTSAKDYVKALDTLWERIK